MGDEIKAFSWGMWVVGAFVSVVAGGMLDVLAVMLAVETKNGFLGLILGAAPGVLIAFFSRRADQNGFGQVLMAGAIFMVLVGGLCGSFVGYGI